MIRGASACVLALTLALGGCLQDTLLGTIGCGASTDCTPPSTVCGADRRCVPGCTADETTCAAGSTCDPTTGDCAGGIIGVSCVDDRGCDPPDVVCRPSTHTCVAGCTIAGDCGTGLACDVLTGRCCDAGAPDCAVTVPPGGDCASDAGCAAGQVCADGACVPSCLSGGACAAPLACDPRSGHCEVPACALDTDCDATSACDAAGSCFVLPHPAPGPCAGGRALSSRCAAEETVAEFVACATPAGPASRPHCLDGSCFDAGLCASPADCHRGAACTAGLCRASDAACTATVSIATVAGGHVGAGKEVCVRGKVHSVRSGYDGLIELKLDDAPYLFADVPPMYRTDGVVLPAIGDTVRVHGTVRWDAGHGDWELSPVDWIGP